MSSVLNGLLALMLLAGGGYLVATGDFDGAVMERLIRGARVTRFDGAEPAPSSPRLMITRAGVPGTEPTAGGTDRTDSRPRRMAEAGAAPAFATPSPHASGAVQGASAVAPPHPIATVPPGSAPASGAGDTARRLASQIQTELQRVGCYKGVIDGDWGPNTRKAMKLFNDRVNATLPVTQPDYILLTLLQGHAAIACGAACPLGMIDAGDGTCRALSVLAEARRQKLDEQPADWAKRLSTTAAASSMTIDMGADKGATGAADAQRGIEERQAALDRATSATAARAEETAARAKAAPDLRAAEAARLAAAEDARRKAEVDPRVAAERARAEAERNRLAAAEQQRQQAAADARARAEAERLARVAAAEMSRRAAETRRQQELAALAERSRLETERMRALDAAKRDAETTPAAHATLRQPATPTAPTPSLAGIALPAPKLSPHTAPAGTDQAAPRARFVGRFMPPPTYRVGRLPPAPPRERVVAQRAAAPVATRSVNGGMRTLFRDLQRSAP